mmetsp:Transcript_35770/g.70238  ORF Transcript_35770/g.70238 Transcript_35770/m.70238 type:complete len:96 (-) Transcript_35770:706-993(-)
MADGCLILGLPCERGFALEVEEADGGAFEDDDLLDGTVEELDVDEFLADGDLLRGRGFEEEEDALADGDLLRDRAEGVLADGDLLRDEAAGEGDF